MQFTMFREVNWKRNLFFIWFGEILAMAGVGMIYPFVPVFLRDHFGIASEQERGMLVAVFYTVGMSSSCIFTPIWGILSDRYGRKLMLLRAYWAQALFYPLLYFSPNIFLFIVLRFLTSVFSGTLTASQALIVTNTPEKKQGFALGFFSTAIGAGHIIGYLIGAQFYSSFGAFWSFMAAGMIYVVGAVGVTLFVQEKFTPVPPEVRKAEKQKKTWHFRDFQPLIWVIFCLFLIIGTARRLDEPYLALLVEGIMQGADSGEIVRMTGYLSMVSAVGALISGVLIGRLCDRYDPLLVTLPLAFVACVTMVIQAFAPSIIIVAVSRFFNYAVVGGLYPAFQTVASRNTDSKIRGTIFGIGASCNIAGWVVAGGIAAVVSFFCRINAVFVSGAVLYVLLFVILLLMRRYLNREKKDPYGTVTPSQSR